MIRQKYGKIINIASNVGVNRIPLGMASYAASKAGVIQLTKVCARELGPYGINVNAIAPGLVITELTYARRKPQEVEQLIRDYKEFTAIGREGNTQDIANLALFLALDDSSLITGQVIVSDGGRMG
jgi:3-oxoacyl-[acyl-carrier protein] reductase